APVRRSCCGFRCRPPSPSRTRPGQLEQRHPMAAAPEMSPYVESNRRVLVVDDNRAIHDDFRKTLGKHRADRDELAELEAELFGGGAGGETEAFELESAYQGEEAVDMVRAARAAGRPFAVAFVDVRMPPGVDGIETTARLLGEDPELNIVICSAYSDHSWEAMAAKLGTTDRVLILKKPFDTIEVRQLARALQKRWALARMAALTVEQLQATVDARTRELAEEVKAREEALRQ